MRETGNSDNIISLAENEAHIWYVFTGKVADTDLLKTYNKILSPEEKFRLKRFVFEKDRHTYLVSHALVRSALSCYADVMPEEWDFTTGRNGKPEINVQSHSIPIRFNLSHTNGLAACIVMQECNIGIDVEKIDTDSSVLEIADKYFSREEVESLYSIPINKQKIRFFENWTLKEAYIKAKGGGLSLPPDQFTFHFNQDKSINISFNWQMNDNAENWQFSLCRLTNKYIIATAIERESSPSLHFKETIPLKYYSNVQI